MPEYKISIPKFGPWFIPEITKSGFSFSPKSSIKPNFTQSPGVPDVINTLFAPNFESNSSTRIGVCKVKECPAALLSLSGATT